MFRGIPRAILDRMHYLESIDARDRSDGTAHRQRLRQITPETGRFIALLAAGAPEGEYLEIGTSAGYSTLWLALACREIGAKLTTFEILGEKARLAAETLRIAGVEHIVHLIHGDAREYLGTRSGVTFCFLDADKEVYGDCYERVVPNLVSGGLLVADNATSHAHILGPMLQRAMTDERVDAMIVPVGRGELLCRKT